MELIWISTVAETRRSSVSQTGPFALTPWVTPATSFPAAMQLMVAA